MTKTAGISHDVGDGAVLCLSARTGDDVPVLRGPGDEVVAQKHCVARSGSMSVGTTYPISVGVDEKVRGPV
jgi:hypothetical protein